MPSRIALIHNSRSRRNTRDRDDFIAGARSIFGSLFLSPDGRVDLATKVADLAGRNVEVIIINGGDGTVSDVISAILASWPHDRLPALVILPSGNTNLIASDVGCRNRGLPALKALLAREKAGTLLADISCRRPVVVSWTGTERTPVAGMFCGLAAFTRGIELAHSPAILERYSHDTAVLATIVWAIRRFLNRATRQQWLDGTPMTLSVDGGAPDHTPRFLFLCTGLHRLSRGVWPFWQGHEPRGGLAYLDILGNPPSLARALFCVLRGRVPKHLRASGAYRSGLAAEIDIETRDRLVMDGEELDTGATGCIRLSQGPEIVFIRS